MFEGLDLLFVFLGGCTGIEGAEIFSLPRFGILLFGIQAILAGLQLSYHPSAPFAGFNF
jgi:hypothetical protein